MAVAPVAPVIVAVKVPLMAAQLPVPPEIVINGRELVLKLCAVDVSDTGLALLAAAWNSRLVRERVGIGVPFSGKRVFAR